jgi:hypothetical protein
MKFPLALLYLTLHDRYRAWKGFDWDVLNRLHERGFIEDPVNKTKSVIFPNKDCASPSDFLISTLSFGIEQEIDSTNF